MDKKLVVYVRDNNYNPKGVVCMSGSGMLSYNEGEQSVPMIVLGWSKAHKNDVFIKKFGREVASRRVDKAHKYIFDKGINEVYISDEVYVPGVPYIIADALETCFDTAKRVYGIDSECIFVVPSITHQSLPKTATLEDTIKHLEDTVTGVDTRKQVTVYNFIRY